MAPAPAAQPVLMPTATDDYKTQLASLEQKLRGEIQAARNQQNASVTRVASTGADDATIRRVQQLIADAEQRHSQELARRFVDAASSFGASSIIGCFTLQELDVAAGRVEALAGVDC